jgi:hypothetical protein
MMFLLQFYKMSSFEVISENIIDEIVEKVTKKVLEEVSQQLTQKVSEEVSKQIPKQHISKQVSAEVSKQNPSKEFQHLKDELKNLDIAMIKMDNCVNCNIVLEEISRLELQSCIEIIDSKDFGMNIDIFPTFLCRKYNKIITGRLPIANLVKEFTKKSINSNCTFNEEIYKKLVDSSVNSSEVHICAYCGKFYEGKSTCSSIHSFTGYCR